MINFFIVNKMRLRGAERTHKQRPDNTMTGVEKKWGERVMILYDNHAVGGARSRAVPKCGITGASVIVAGLLSET